MKNKSNEVLTFKRSSAKKLRFLENEIKEARAAGHNTYNNIPEEDRIDISGNLKGKSNTNTVVTLKKDTVKREKYFEDEVKKENIKNVSEEDSIDIINNLSFNRL